MKLTSAGESHGKALVGILENVPSNLKLDIEKINLELSLRQSGYGRGLRQNIEKDTINILSGVRNLKTLGSPIAFLIENKDYKNWQEIIAPECCDESKRIVTKVRPGHADLSGLIKYNTADARNILERASARETAVRVASGSICKQFLNVFGISIAGYVKNIGGLIDNNNYIFDELKNSKKSELFMLDKKLEKLVKEKIDLIKEAGDTLGGVVEVRVKGLKSGFGSFVSYFQKLDSVIGGAVLSIQACKGVEFGLGFTLANLSGKKAHDEIYFEDNKFKRYSNNAGGIEGGMSNSEDIVVSAVMKPIPTLKQGLKTVDYISKKEAIADTERSDVVAVPAFLVVVENVIATVLSEVIQDRLGGDNMEEILARWNNLK